MTQVKSDQEKVQWMHEEEVRAKKSEVESLKRTIDQLTRQVCLGLLTKSVVWTSDVCGGDS